jgi:hypothetical protein
MAWLEMISADDPKKEPPPPPPPPPEDTDYRKSETPRPIHR